MDCYMNINVNSINYLSGLTLIIEYQMGNYLLLIMQVSLLYTKTY